MQGPVALNFGHLLYQVKRHSLGVLVDDRPHSRRDTKQSGEQEVASLGPGGFFFSNQQVAAELGQRPAFRPGMQHVAWELEVVVGSVSMVVSFDLLLNPSVGHLRVITELDLLSHLHSRKLVPWQLG